MFTWGMTDYNQAGSEPDTAYLIAKYSKNIIKYG
jgi:hypothetical protein